MNTCTLFVSFEAVDPITHHAKNTLHYTTLYLYTLTLHRLLIAPFEKVLFGMLLKCIVRQPTRFRR